MRVAVIGAGAFGGWTALHLRRLGCDVVLIDERGPGNPLSSSGGETRVIRSIYGPDRIYVEMVKRAFPMWESLGVYTTTGALWMVGDDDAYVRAALPIVRELGFAIDELTIGEARRRWPEINFDGVRNIYFERKAGALFARRACVAVRDLLVKEGGTYATSRVEADVHVYACGPWLGQLFPDVIGDRIRPTRQEIFYFDAETPALPTWLDFGERIFYGIPSIDGHGFKVADDTRGETVDPTTQSRVASEDGLARARRFLATRFSAIANAPLRSAEVCQYENSPDGNLIIDRHPDAKNVWLVGGGSGHGFKLAPAVGELVADAIVNGAEVPAMFRLDRNATAKTQFES